MHPGQSHWALGASSPAPRSIPGSSWQTPPPLVVRGGAPHVSCSRVLLTNQGQASLPGQVRARSVRHSGRPPRPGRAVLVLGAHAELRDATSPQTCGDCPATHAPEPASSDEVMRAPDVPAARQHACAPYDARRACALAHSRSVPNLVLTVLWILCAGRRVSSAVSWHAGTARSSRQ